MEGNISVIFDPQDCDNEHIIQVISKVRSLVEKINQRVIVFCAQNIDNSGRQLLFRYGANEIIICNKKEELEIIQVVEITYEMALKYTPKVILVPATNRGKAVAAMLSIRLDAGLTADCIDIDFDESGELYFKRTAINDSVIAKIEGMNCSIKMGTVKKDVFSKKEYEITENNIVSAYSCNKLTDIYQSNWKIVDIEKKEPVKEIDLNSYKIVFAIGRGIQSRKLYERICVLAEKYNAGIIGTRAAVEEGLIERERQVGQSGKVISPNLYVGFGVSGASQHIVGIKDAGNIIAINSDKNAKIFEYADYAIVEDVEHIVDELEQITK